MALEKLKQEMLASIDQYTRFVETEAESLDAYTTALSANQSDYNYLLVEFLNVSIVSSSQEDARCHERTGRAYSFW